MVTGKPLQQLNYRVRPLWFFACVVAVLTLPASAPAAGADRRYALAEHGFFQLSVPAGWSDQIDEKSQPPLISFRQSAGPPFIVSVTPVWQATRPAASRDELRAEVGRMAAAIRLFAVEQDIKLNEFAGAAGPGFYFFATDAAPGPGEFKFMNRGMLRVGDLAVTFTILTNEGQDAIVRAALEMLKAAVHVPQ